MTGLAICLVAVMTAVGILHTLWALRIWWPIRDEAELARTVVGADGITRMPAAAITWVVILLIALGVTLVAQLMGWIALPVPHWVTMGGVYSMAGVLILRGVSSYLPPVRNLAQSQPFRRLNLWIYSPLILALGVGVLVLAWAG